jgi:hypothetical protein
LFLVSKRRNREARSKLQSTGLWFNRQILNRTNPNPSKWPGRQDLTGLRGLRPWP